MYFWCSQWSINGGLCFSFYRYLESCATSALKRKSESLSIVTSSSSSMSEEDKPATATHEDTVNTDGMSLFQPFLHPPKPLHSFLPSFSCRSCARGRWCSGQPGVCGFGHDGSGSGSAAYGPHDLDRSHERCVCHQSVQLQQHYSACAAARVGWVYTNTTTVTQKVLHIQADDSPEVL